MKYIIFCLKLGLSISVFGQSKKQQIEMLTVSKDSIQSLLNKEREDHTSSKNTLTNQIDELNNQINELKRNSETQNATIANLESQLKKLETQLQVKEQENFTQKNTIDNLNSQNSQLNNDFREKLTEISDLKHQIESKSDSIMNLTNELKKIKDSFQITSDANKIEKSIHKSTKSFNTLSYDFDETIGGDFNQNYDTIINKERARILKSNVAKRDVSLKIKLFSGETISIGSLSEHDGMEETHNTYLFEDELNGKLFYVMINYSIPGSGAKKYTLIELDLNTGNKKTLISNIGGDFSFNNNNTFLIVSGWYASEDYVKDNQLNVINILNRKTDLVLKDVEPININWLTDKEFQCQLLKYSKENEWPYSRIPSEIRTGNLNIFTYNNGFWSKK